MTIIRISSNYLCVPIGQGKRVSLYTFLTVYDIYDDHLKGNIVVDDAVNRLDDLVLSVDRPRQEQEKEEQVTKARAEITRALRYYFKLNL